MSLAGNTRHESAGESRRERERERKKEEFFSREPVPDTCRATLHDKCYVCGNDIHDLCVRVQGERECEDVSGETGESVSTRE